MKLRTFSLIKGRLIIRDRLSNINSNKPIPAQTRNRVLEHLYADKLTLDIKCLT